jgi:hypothetical protein
MNYTYVRFDARCLKLDFDVSLVVHATNDGVACDGIGDFGD